MKASAWPRIRGNKVKENWPVPCTPPRPYHLPPFPRPEGGSALVQTGQDLGFTG